MARKNKSKNSGIISFFKDDRLKITLGMFFLGFALFLLLAFVSYFFTWKADQSFEWSKVISGPEVQVENWSGKGGARLANLLVSKWFGIAAFAIPFLLTVIGFRLFKIRLLPLRKTIKITVIAAILLSIILGYFTGNDTSYLGSGPGGAHGYFISEWLNAVIGKTGTAVLLIVVTSSFFVFVFPGFSQKFTKLFQRENLPGSSEKDVTFKETKEDISKEITDDTVDLVFENTSPVNKDHTKKIDEEIELTIEPRKDVNGDASSGKHISNINTAYDPTADLSDYQFPTINILEEHKLPNSEVSNEELIRNKNRIVDTLANYKIQIDKIKATIGPTVTLYEIVPAAGVRISKIKNLEDDIALSLAALGIRIIAPIPGRGTIGIEVPNQKPEIVSMRSIIASKKFQETEFDLPIALGKTISNETFVIDLAKMPHLLVAGATGQGKSVGLNAIITSLLYKKHPSQLKFVLVDPKKVELTPYAKLEKHFLAKLPDTEEPIITDTQKVIYTLNSLTVEMEQRYDLLKAAHVRNLKEYNAKFISRKLNPEKGHRYMPYIVVIIDEFADMIMTAGREIETPIARLAQLARAIGIHLVIATQRPTTNIITGVIKANFPARIAFRVSSMIDSRTILDTPGANQLIGRGDMLISTGSDLTRIQCAFIDTPETETVTDFIGSQRGYPSAFMLPEYEGAESDDANEVDLRKRDDIFDEAARLVVIHQQGSTSLIQRKFSIGYNRAGRIIDQLEAAGVVGPFEGSKARQVLITDEYTLERILNDLP